MERAKWPRCSQGTIATRIHTRGEFYAEEQPGSDCQPYETHVAFPAELYDGRDEMIDQAYIPRELLPTFGWQIVNGLGPNDIPQMSGGSTLVVPYRDQWLVPPPGLWHAHLPTQIRRQEVRPSPETGWFDIFDINQGYLAWPKGAPLARQGIRNHYVNIGIGHMKWCFHQSVAGLREMLTKQYGERFSLSFYSLDRKGVLDLHVPTQDVRHWIGAGGSNVRFLSHCLRVSRVHVYEYRGR
jgi:hypothetical protein